MPETRTWAVVKREFGESVRTKTFIIGTLFGPVLIVALIVLPMLLADEAGGERSLAVIDASGQDLGEAVAAVLPQREAAAEPAGDGGAAAAVAADDRRVYELEMHAVSPDEAEPLREHVRRRVAADELHGYIWIPAGAADSATVLYEGKNATNFGEMAEVRAAVRTAVREHRLNELGIDPGRVALALRPVGFEARKSGEGTASGGAEATFLLAYMLGFAIYMVVILYGQAVMRGVLEEKRDRIIEIMVSSIRATQLLVGKVLGIGAASLVQVAIWVGFAALALTQGEAVAASLGGSLPELPDVPLRVGVVFLLFFTGGFLLYSIIYAAVGAIVTSDQEAQQLQFIVLAPLLAAIVLMMPVLTNPGGQTATITSLIPLTSPVLMPMRAAMTEVPAAEVAAGTALLLLTSLASLWVAAKIYRIGMLATGKRPSVAELWRWVRTA